MFMKRIERNRLYMVQSVGKVAENYKDAWTDYPEFVELFATLKGYEDQFQALSQKKALLLQPFGGIKQELRDDFALSIGKLAAYLVRIGRQQKDQMMVLGTNFTVAQFGKYSAQKTLLTAQNVIAFAEQYEVTLSAIPNGAELLAKAKEQLLVFIDKGLIPAERRRLLGETTTAIKRLSSEIMDFLKNELDLMMRVFVDESEEFHLAYTNARVIPKYAGAKGTSSSEGSDGSDSDAGDGSNDPLDASGGGLLAA